MTRQELDDAIFKRQYYIADSFKDIQMASSALKNVEDETKNLQNLMKIKDAVEDIKRTYYELDDLMYAEPDEEEDSFGYE
jgi:hypothetical protein